MDAFLDLATLAYGGELIPHLHPDVRALLADPAPWRGYANAQVYDGHGAGAGWLRALIGASPSELWDAWAGELTMSLEAGDGHVELRRAGALSSTSRLTVEDGALVERVGHAVMRWRVSLDREGGLVLGAEDATLAIEPHPYHRRTVIIHGRAEAGALAAGTVRLSFHDVGAARRPVQVPEGRPLRVAVLGGGLAGLAAADALVASVRGYNRTFAADREPIALEVQLFQLGRELGGKAASVPIDLADSSMNPRQPVRFNMTHGLHFVWGYPHFRDLLGPDLQRRWLSPPRGTSSYVTWLSDRDTIDGESRLAVLNICDPERPDDARIPECRTLLHLYREVPELVHDLVETIMRVDIRDFLHFGDIILNRRELSAVSRWMLLFGAITARRMRDPEHAVIPGVRGRLQDEEYLAAISEARRRWIDSLREEIDDLLGAVASPPKLGILDGLTELVGRTGHAMKAWARLLLRAPQAVSLSDVAALVSLLAQDLYDLARAADELDFTKHAYLRVPLDAAFSSPFALDAATAIRDMKLGTRTYRDALVQVFDGDDPHAVVDAIAGRIDRDQDSVAGKVRRLSPVRAVHRDGASGELLVEVWPPVTRHPPTWRPIVHPYPHHQGEPPATENWRADLVVSTLPPANLAWMLADSQLGPELEPLRASMAELARHTNETINLQVFFRERIELPFPKYHPPEADPPFCISGIEGPFTILADLRRALSPERFQEVRIAPGDGPFDGTAWDLVGAYAELFTHNPSIRAGRQWPSAVQDELAAMLHDPGDHDPEGRDERPWAYDWETGRPQPVFGEVLAERSKSYGEVWRNKAAPLIVATTLRQLLSLPGWDPAERAKLESAITEGRYWWALARNCHEHNKFISTEPGVFELRPHARFETRAENLYLAGDWTRNGSDLICMDATVASGYHAAAAILERLRATRPEWADLQLPRFFPGSVPGGWDESP